MHVLAVYLDEQTTVPQHICVRASTVPHTALVHALPAYCNTQNVKHLLAQLLSPHTQFSVTLQPDMNEHKGFFHAIHSNQWWQTAHVLFVSANGLRELLAAVCRVNGRKVTLSNTEHNVLPRLGLAKYSSDYTRHWHIDEKALQTDIDYFMTAFDREQSAVASKKRVSEPDEEGWQTVMGRAQQLQSAPPPVTQLLTNRKNIRKHKKNKQLSANHFYKFQVREKKNKQLNELKDKFEEDRKRIAAEKAKRKFAPG